MPEKSILNKKPNRVNYRNSELRFRHYGRNVQLLIDQAVKIQDPEEKENAIIYIGRLMKGFQTAWNRDNVENEVIIKDMEIMSKRQLTIDIQKVAAENLFESSVRNDRKQRPNNMPNNMPNNNNNNRNNRKNNRRRRPN
jgi:hypothetical protein